MKTCVWLSLIGSMAMTCSARAQGTLIFDQQSSAHETITGELWAIQPNQPFGQSFVPTLSSIGFVRLRINPGSGPVVPDATVYVNLRSDSITGPVLGSTLPVHYGDYFNGYTTFIFPSAVPLTAGTTYYLQPVGSTAIVATSFDYNAYQYPSGNLFRQGIEQVGWDLWFREGIVVPEPSISALAAVALCILLSNHNIQRMRASRSGQPQSGSPRRLVPAARASR